MSFLEDSGKEGNRISKGILSKSKEEVNKEKIENRFKRRESMVLSLFMSYKTLNVGNLAKNGRLSGYHHKVLLNCLEDVISQVFSRKSAS